MLAASLRTIMTALSFALMREPIFTVGVLAFALLACGRPGGQFRAKSVHAPDYTQIAKEAVELDHDDVEAVSVAGGERIGQYLADPERTSVTHDVAAYGGTHFLARAERTRETGGRFVPGGWVTTSRTTVLFDVFRVPANSWESLPRELRPVKP